MILSPDQVDAETVRITMKLAPLLREERPDVAMATMVAMLASYLTITSRRADVPMPEVDRMIDHIARKLKRDVRFQRAHADIIAKGGHA